MRFQMQDLVKEALSVGSFWKTNYLRRIKLILSLSKFGNVFTIVYIFSTEAESPQSREKHKIQETGTAEVFLPDQIIMKRGKSEAGKTTK